MVWVRHVCSSHAAKLSSPVNPSPHFTSAHSCKWQPAPTTWTTLNTDGVVSSSSHRYVGGLLWDVEGSWIAGFNRAIGMTNALQAEFGPSMTALFLCVANLLHRAWMVDISWIPREGNGPADWLAKKALGSSCSSFWGLR
ncbi:hypothetical protein V6N13_001200 [Hibiscus sabdariffa]|uniref:RNase H type-1 domain-containing protein n=1 Tax=Hibiscus sabdariffa TaxID=183260 RepID=A0ABR2G926_9ROSI